MKTEKLTYAGWPNCYRLFDGELEMVVLADVGPRIIRLAIPGGENQFFEDQPHLGLTGGEDFRVYGGHRFWIAPEGPRTMHPDNVAVAVETRATSVLFTSPAEPSGIQRQLEVSISAGARARVVHRVFNRAGESITLAPWALTVMPPGGRGLMPFPPRAAHGPLHLLPESSLALWSYTDFSDPRWTFTSQLIQLRQMASADWRFPTQKTGVHNLDGWIAYSRDGSLFMKKTGGRAGIYPDRDSNVELFTNEKFLELETLGPLVELGPGGSVQHLEHWRLWQNVRLPEGGDALFLDLTSYAETILASPE
jgi:hypothetical protein